MAVPFGFSVGDFIGVIGLVDDVRKALKDVGGAEDDFQQALIELQQLELVLAQLGDGGWGTGCDPSHVNAVRGMALTSQVPLRGFLQKIDKYKQISRKGSTCVSISARGLGRKAQWAVVMQDELTKFRTTITGKVVAMHLLLSIPTASALSRMESSQMNMENKLLAKIEDCRNGNNNMATDIASLQTQQDGSTANIARLVGICTGMNVGVNKIIHVSQVRSQKMHVALRKMERWQRRALGTIPTAMQEVILYIDRIKVIAEELARALGAFSAEVIDLLKRILQVNLKTYEMMCRLLQGLPQRPMQAIEDCIHFQDALGRVRNLPYQLFRHWEVFEAMLRCDFKTFPGELLVANGRYYILDARSKGRVIQSSRWSRSVFPGTEVNMSMLIAERLFQPGLCPRCDHPNVGPEESPEISVTCSNCQLQYTRLPTSTSSMQTGCPQLESSTSVSQTEQLPASVTSTMEISEHQVVQPMSISDDINIFKRIHIELLPSPSSNAVIQDTLDWIHAHANDARNTKSNIPMISIGLLKTYFEEREHKRLQDILFAVFEPDDPPVQVEEILRDYVGIFCILLYVGKVKYIQQFVQKGLSDGLLPFSTCPPAFPQHENFFEQFQQKQWIFIPHHIDLLDDFQTPPTESSEPPDTKDYFRGRSRYLSRESTDSQIRTSSAYGMRDMPSVQRVTNDTHYNEDGYMSAAESPTSIRDRKARIPIAYNNKSNGSHSRKSYNNSDSLRFETANNSRRRQSYYGQSTSMRSSSASRYENKLHAAKGYQQEVTSKLVAVVAGNLKHSKRQHFQADSTVYHNDENVTIKVVRPAKIVVGAHLVLSGDGGEVELKRQSTIRNSSEKSNSDSGGKERNYRRRRRENRYVLPPKVIYEDRQEQSLGSRFDTVHPEMQRRISSTRRRSHYYNWIPVRNSFAKSRTSYYGEGGGYI